MRRSLIEDQWESQCNWCGVVASQVTSILEHERTEHVKEREQQHLEEFGHELNSPACKAHGR